MNPASDHHGQDYSELVFIYALQALPASEAAAVGEHIAGCSECQDEIETLRPIVDSFVFGQPTYCARRCRSGNASHDGSPQR